MKNLFCKVKHTLDKQTNNLTKKVLDSYRTEVKSLARSDIQLIDAQKLD